MLDPRARTMWRLTALLTLAVPTSCLAAVGAATAGAAAAAAAIATGAVAAGLSWWVVGRRWATWGYAERDSDLLVRRGVVFQRVTVVPYGRMQLVDVVSGPVERRFGLATVALHTAAAASDAVVRGVATEEAHRLRDRLAALGKSRAAGL
jgi:uncharacterized protein